MRGTDVSHLIEYPLTRHAEPCNRGSLKVAHNSFIFLEETAAVEVTLTQQSLHGTVHKELLATAEPGRPTRQAPRLPVALVEALERNVLQRKLISTTDSARGGFSFSVGERSVFRTTGD